MIEEATAQVSFLEACIKFFGMKHEQKRIEFLREVRLLTDADRIEIAAGLTKLGYNIKADTITQAVPQAAAAELQA